MRRAMKTTSEIKPLVQPRTQRHCAIKTTITKTAVVIVTWVPDENLPWVENYGHFESLGPRLALPRDTSVDSHSIFLENKQLPVWGVPRLLCWCCIVFLVSVYFLCLVSSLSWPQGWTLHLQPSVLLSSLLDCLFWWTAVPCPLTCWLSLFAP